MNVMNSSIIKWVDGLMFWRTERNISKPSGKFFDMVKEEIYEYAESETEHDRVDAIADIIVLSANELALEGYDIDKVMDEVVKEISSRVQDPEQEEAWDLGLRLDEKWMKSVLPEHKKLWYKADYSKCKQ